MAPTHDGTRAPECRAPRWLVRLANATALYPLFLLGSLYGQWLVSWWILGHRPRPSLDDPKDLVGASWLCDGNVLALVGFVPMVGATALLNTVFFCAHREPSLRLCLRILGILGLWIGTLLFLRADPWRVVEWLVD